MIAAREEVDWVNPDEPWWVSPGEYLAFEEGSETKHEYVNGAIYAMAGAQNRHNRVSGNLYAELHVKLRGQRCQPCNSDTRVRVRRNADEDYYYPDAMVVCDPNEDDDVFQDRPVVIFEVISRSTARFDRVEKLHAYQSIPSLRVYAIVEGERMAITCYFRADENTPWSVKFLKDKEQTLALPSIGCELPLAEIYARTGLEKEAGVEAGSESKKSISPLGKSEGH